MTDPFDIEALAEGKDFEAKLAGGASGKGELPKSFFETYSAFANTDGGVVLLGLREVENGRLEVQGIVELAKVQKALWDNLNNPKAVSINLLSNEHVDVITVDQKSVLRIVVPRAPRKQQPVFLGTNPLSGTFRRGHAGDYKAPEEVVRRMLAEQVEDVRDMRILAGPLGLGEIDRGTLKRYRQVYRNGAPVHPWNQLDDLEFLRQIGAHRRDRETGMEGLTAAGILMFGQLVEIRDTFPNYMLDYQERGEPTAGVRWTDRLTTDGSFSGNLYDFYHLVIQRLTRDLRVPFRLRGDTRVDDTPVHEALREALVNTLIHADYTGRVSVLVVRRPDQFGFRNPGAMRMPVEAALAGGVSDCRNRRLQDMFRYVGLGEQAGSGIAKIRAAWTAQHWRAPALYDTVDPFEQTTFTLRMASLLPPDAVTALEARFGDAFKATNETQQLALVTAEVEQKVTHARLRTMTTAHTRDLTVALSSLVQKGMLESAGTHKGTYYFLPGSPPDDVGGSVPFDAPELRSSVPSGPRLPSSSVPTRVTPGSSVPSAAGSSVPSDPDAPESSGQARVLEASGQSLRLRPQPSLVDEPAWAKLEAIAEPLRGKMRASPEDLRSMLLELCTGRYLSLPELAWLTGRTAETLRIKHVGPLVQEDRLRQRYPDAPTHPGQAYTKADA